MMAYCCSKNHELECVGCMECEEEVETIDCDTCMYYDLETTQYPCDECSEHLSEYERKVK
jgi:hypothetical protein